MQRLTIWALALRQSDWRSCGLCVGLYADNELHCRWKYGDGKTRIFHFNLNSTFPICNRGQTLTCIWFREKNYGRSFYLSISKVATGPNCFEWLTDGAKLLTNHLTMWRETNSIPDCFWHRSFANYSLPLDEINLWSCYLPDRCFSFVLYFLSLTA